MTEQESVDTRQRLLEAAGEIFAEQGFRAATVRDICSRAGANVAAVNYHFGDKMKLYAEVLKYAYNSARQKYPADMGLGPDATAHQRLEGFIRALVYRILDESRLAWHGKLMFREMIEPTEALQELVQEAIRPEFERLQRLLQEMLGTQVDSEQVLQHVWSVTGQCLFYHHARHIVAMLRPGGAYGQDDMKRIADHVVRFTRAAIEREQNGEHGKSR